MDSYREFVNEAERYHKTLPYETVDLYKKYSVDIQLLSGEREFRQLSRPAVESAAFVAETESKMHMRFDVVVSDGMARCASPHARILEGDRAAGIVSSKIFRSSEDKIAAFLNAKSRYYVVIDVPSGEKAAVNMLFASTGHLPVQVIINLARNSALNVSEYYASNTEEDPSLMAVLHEINAQEGSRAQVSMLHNENGKTDVASIYKALAAQDAHVELNSVYCGGRYTKARGTLDASGPMSRMEATELVLGSEDQAFDINTVINNVKPMSYTDLRSGAVLDGASRCMLKGFAKVENKARGASSRITERGILLSPDAHIDALPDMAIDYSNEVRATHSASTSPIDTDALFYMTSRGLDEAKARQLFVAAFIAKYIARMESPAMREVAMSVLLDKLETGRFGTLNEVTPRNIWITGKT